MAEVTKSAQTETSPKQEEQKRGNTAKPFEFRPRMGNEVVAPSDLRSLHVAKLRTAGWFVGIEK